MTSCRRQLDLAYRIVNDFMRGTIDDGMECPEIGGVDMQTLYIIIAES